MEPGPTQPKIYEKICTQCHGPSQSYMARTLLACGDGPQAEVDRPKNT